MSTPMNKRTLHEVSLMYFVELFLTMVAVSSILANVFTSFVILKYKKLRKDVTNILLLHVNTVEILFLISTTLTLWQDILGKYTDSIVSICMAYELEGALVLCVFLLLIVMATDGCMQTCSPNNYGEFRRIYAYLFLALMYVATIIAAYFLSHYCTGTPIFYGDTLDVNVFVSLGMLVFVFVMNVVHRTKAKRSADSRAATSTKNVGLAITNIFMLAWSMTVYPAVLVGNFAYIPVLSDVLKIVAVGICAAIPVFKLIYLYRCHDDFNVFLKRAFSCDCSNHQGGHRLEPSVAYNDASGGVLISQRGHVA